MNNLFEKFLREHGLTRSKETMRGYRWNLKQYEHYLTDNSLEVSSVIKDDVEKFLLKCSSLQLRKIRLRLIKRLYNYLKRIGLALLNPASGIKLLHKIETKVPQVPGRKHIARLTNFISNTKSTTSTRNHLLLELAYGSGLRRCELMALNIEDINQSTGIARIHGKGNKIRMVPVTKKALELIRRYLSVRSPSMSGPLFLSIIKRKRLTNIGISKAFENNIGIRPHLLRHACATHMLDNGCDIRFIQALLGHKCLSVTQRYTQVSKRKLAEVINRLHPSNGITGNKQERSADNTCKKG